MNEKGFKRWGCSPAFTYNRSSTPGTGKIFLSLVQGLNRFQGPPSLLCSEGEGATPTYHLAEREDNH
jgi:hypothetical protein